MTKTPPTSSKTSWTEKRLQGLFDHYNRAYWRGKLRQYTLRIRKLDSYGVCNFKKREILIDVDSHRNKDKIRATLLHEMAHVAVGKPGHGYEFWGQNEHLLRRRAPVEIGIPEAPGLTILADVVPRKFPLARKAMEKANAARQREVLRIAKNLPVFRVSEDCIVDRFREAAWMMTERNAVWAVGEEFGLIDVAGEPIPKWVRLISNGRKAFRSSRRDFLQVRKQESIINRPAC